MAWILASCAASTSVVESPTSQQFAECGIQLVTAEPRQRAHGRESRKSVTAIFTEHGVSIRTRAPQTPDTIQSARPAEKPSNLAPPDRPPAPNRDRSRPRSGSSA
ncbi:MAG TPA: hypothetical protein VN969_28680 [Streptosporangiaceae bacterium]|nr:hypothetical protein [Streptosporangiaceae bacterium]